MKREVCPFRAAFKLVKKRDKRKNHEYPGICCLVAWVANHNFGHDLCRLLGLSL